MTHGGRKVLLKLCKGETAGVDYIVHDLGRLNHNINLAEP
jgi:hypothetical protein